MVSGAVDMGEADTSGIFAVLSKAPGVAWYVASVTANYVAFVARSGTKIEKVADLKGKTIATSGPNTAPQVVVELAMSKAGLAPSDATFFTAPGSNHQALMEKGAVDGAISYVPFTAQMILSKVGHLLFTASDVYGKPWPGGGNFVRQAFAKEHGDEVTEVLRHVKRAQDVIKSRPKDTAAALSKLLQIDSQTVTYSYERKLVTELPLIPDMRTLLDQAELLHRSGLLKVDPEPFLRDLINPSFALAAAKQH
jgi:ABC-type nitrate/sulfonate/bicarbonate transport system substrate-binding protein